ncbi:MAG: CDP-alcohol phosphatidyltransferase family protein [Candidatus Hermodarchaeota archaeon]
MLLQLKKFSERLLLPLGKKLTKVPANYITFSGLLCAILSCTFFIFNNILLVIIFLFLTEFFDQLDGVVARLQGPTKFGGFFDSTLDRYGDIFIIVGVVLGGYTSSLIGFIVLSGAILTSYTRAKIESLGIESLGGIGLLERTDRVPILLIGVIIQIWIPQSIWWTMIFLAIGTHITALQRIIYAYRNIRNDKINSN